MKTKTTIMKLFLPLSLLLLMALYATAQTPTDLFFSEYVEGTGNNKALEIYNPTNQTIDLTNYYVVRFSNGSSTFTEGGSTRLTGTLAPHKTFVLVNGQTTSTSTSPACSPELQAMANQLDGIYPAPTYMNGNDAMALVKTPGGVAPNADMSNVTPVDLIGQIGLGAAITAETGWSYVKDSTLTYNNSEGIPVTGKVINYIVQSKATDGATYGPFWMSWTSDHVLIRKFNIIKGVVANPNPFKVTAEWDTVPAIKDTAGHWVYKDIWTNLGKHNCTVAPFVSKITVSSSENKTIIDTKEGTLQMMAEILPNNAADKTILWSVNNGTGKGSITNNGLLTAQEDGEITVIASAQDDSGISGSLKITISNNAVGISNSMETAQQIIVYPNPLTFGSLTVVSPFAIQQIEIFSAIGQSVYKQSYNSQQTMIEIGNLELKKGMYLIKIIDFKNSINAKKLLVN